MNTTPPRYIPALGYRWLTGLYDPVAKLTTRESEFKAALLPQFMLDAGLAQVEETQGFTTIFGTMSLYRACKSA